MLRYEILGTGQIIGMSATLSNIEQISKFLKATVFSTKFRPVSMQQLFQLRVLFDLFRCAAVQMAK